mmetsp:Transcript_23488/g.30562  ORF Transcript_23488/g.30562 Transcript_23488/m.30562 type:complete len:119 (+) Transcript_23488:89-445(+)
MGFLSQQELNDVLKSSLVFVSPIVAATGLNTKNILALEHGIPLVTTTFGAEGMSLPTSTSSPVLVANGIEEFVRQVELLYNDPVVWNQQRLYGFEHLNEKFSEASMKQSLSDMLKEVS